MAKLTKFTLSPTGDLVYKSTGRIAPNNYVFRKNTVYKIGADGVKRRVGTLSRKLTKAEATKIAKAESTRQTQRMRNMKRLMGYKGPMKETPFGPMPEKKRPRQKKPKQPEEIARQKNYISPYADLDDLDETEFPELDKAVMEEFAQRVREAALSVAPPWLQARIQALSTQALWKAYQQDAYIFEVYFKYHDPLDPPHKSDVSMWVYQFVTRIEQFMGVKL